MYHRLELKNILIFLNTVMYKNLTEYIFPGCPKIFRAVCPPGNISWSGLPSGLQPLSSVGPCSQVD